MQYTPSGGRTIPGPEGWFTGAVWLDSVRVPDAQSAVGGNLVRFAPGARTYWHTHPVGQTLYVTEGIGWAGTRDRVQEIRPGDVVYFEPFEEHWHGATADRYMSHLAVQEADESGTMVTWLEPVTDEDYPGS